MKKIIFSFLFLGILFFTGCEEKTYDAYTNDVTIDISGTWSISKVLQNDVDITTYFDFSSFGLTFNYESDTPSTFALTGDNIPFATLNTPVFSFTQGKWEFDNAMYPSEISLKGTTDVKMKLVEPLTAAGNTRLVLEFNLGCGANEYVYELQKK